MATNTQNPLLGRFNAYLHAIDSAVKQQIDGITALAKQIKLECPDAIPIGCQLLADRSMRGGAELQIPMLYIIDSIVKNVREPWNSGFSEVLPVIFDHAWVVGAPGLHEKLRRLVGLWRKSKYFSDEAMDMLDASMHASRPPVQQQRPSQPVDPRLSKQTNGAGIDNNTTDVQTNSQMNANKTKMTRDPRLAKGPPQPDVRLQPPEQQPEILALLANAGDLASLVGVQANMTSIEPLRGPLTNEMVKNPDNQGAIDRLQAATAAQLSKFLDNKFLKRKIRENQTDASTMWYLDLETWYGTVTGSGDVLNEGNTEATLDAWQTDQPSQLPDELSSVPADDHQTACAVSGEKFEKYWDDTLQEWRYLEVARVDAVTARRLGVPDGSLVCISVLDSDDIACIVTAATSNGTLGADGAPDAKRVKTE
jgi:hypothetical protein